VHADAADLLDARDAGEEQAPVGAAALLAVDHEEDLAVLLDLGDHDAAREAVADLEALGAGVRAAVYVAEVGIETIVDLVVPWLTTRKRAAVAGPAVVPAKAGEPMVKQAAPVTE
jgi:hypothetical protein